MEKCLCLELIEHEKREMEMPLNIPKEVEEKILSWIPEHKREQVLREATRPRNRCGKCLEREKYWTLPEEIRITLLAYRKAIYENDTDMAYKLMKIVDEFGVDIGDIPREEIPIEKISHNTLQERLF